tara:strand:+ start:255 stop:932 length:678 start_codon:yes stop_codon:yes gene_type:complete
VSHNPDLISIVAIGGASASGKSRFAAQLKRHLLAHWPHREVALIPEDAYYRDQQHLSFSQRLQTNYDQPEAFEHALLAQHLWQLRRGEAIELPAYNFPEHTRMPYTTPIAVPNLVLVEGILVLSNPALREVVDLCVYIDTPLDVCLQRRIRRDMSERGRTRESVIAQFETMVRPAYEQHIEPSKQYADVVVAGNGSVDSAIEHIASRIIEMQKTEQLNTTQEDAS